MQKQKLDERENAYRQVKNSPKEKQQKASESVNASQIKSSMIIKKCLQQNRDFQKWYDKKLWRTFHSSHYDWWAFPIDEFSSHGDKYKISEREIKILKQSKQFMQALQSNAKMVCYAWGYDLQKGQLIKAENEDHRWHNWPIRLYKMTKSLEIFGVTDSFQNAVKYGCILIKDGKNFHYNKRELSEYFLEKYEFLFKGKSQQSKNEFPITDKLKQSTKKNTKSEVKTKDIKKNTKL